MNAPLKRPSVLGRPHTRVDGPAKVTGEAVFAADEPIDQLAYAVLATSPLGRGRIEAIDLTEARSIPGVLDILTHEAVADAVSPVDHLMAGGFANSTWRPLASDAIAYAGQIVGLVVADSLQVAQEAEAKMRISYAVEPGAFALEDVQAKSRLLSELRPADKDREVGDPEQALGCAAAMIDAEYATPIQHHNPMELFTTTCIWRGDKLTVYEPTRYVGAVQHGLAAQLRIDPTDIRVVARFIGGHFGSKFGLSQYTALTALAAKRVGRPVTLATSRADGFTIATHRTETRHHIRLGANADGRLTALVHDATCATSRFDLFATPGTEVTSALYGCANVRTIERVAEVDRNTPGPMRAPPEVPYLFALESAIDEIAHVLGEDPLELRRKNDTSVDGVTGRPFTTRPLMRCFDAAADAFGWKERRPAGTRREGDWWIGLGCASAARPVKSGPATIRLTLSANGRATVETAHHEIGNGLYTLLAMSAAEGLGVPVDAVTVRLGDTDLPAAGLSGGSSTTTSLANAMAQGCAELTGGLRRAAAADDGPLAGANAERLQLIDGVLVAEDGRSIGVDRVLIDMFGGEAELLIEYTPDGMGADAIDKLRQGRFQLVAQPPDKLAWAFGAQFAEVRVHARTGEVRAPRSARSPWAEF